MVSYEQWCSELWLLGTTTSKEKGKNSQEVVSPSGKQNEKAGEKVDRVSLW